MSINGVWQLTQLTLTYCRASGTSAGARCVPRRASAERARPRPSLTRPTRPSRSAFVKGGLAAFAAANPQLTVNIAVKPGKAPTLIARYADGTGKHVDVKREDAAGVALAAARLRDAATATVRHFRRPVITRRPTVQGVWGPDVVHAPVVLRTAAAPTAATSAGHAAAAAAASAAAAPA